MGLLNRLHTAPHASGCASFPAELDGRAARLKLLADLAGGLLDDPEPEAVLARLFQAAPDDLGLDVCFVFEAEPEGRELRLAVSLGLDAVPGGLARLPYGEALCGQVAVTGAPVFANGISTSEGGAFVACRSIGLEAYAGYPLLRPGEDGALLGVLAFGSRRRTAFGDEDLEFFAAIAHHVAAVRERLRADAALKDSERQFRTLADSIPQHAWIARPDGWILWFNRRWHDFTGTTPDEARGWGWRSVHHPDHLDRVVAHFQRSLHTGLAWEDTFPMRSRDGEWRWFLSRALPVRDAEGRIVMWFGTNTDVTEQRAAEHALRTARDEAERANRSKSTFLASASHDLRQPLQSMFLFAAALERHIGSDVGREALTHLQRGMDALKGLLDSLLDVSRLEAGVVTPEVREFAIADVLTEIDSTYAPVAAGKGLDWRMEPCRETVRSDPTLLARIIRNLVENAVRYTERGFIRVDCRVVGDVLRIGVRDTGIGIPAQHLDRIWDEFHQVGNPERDRAQGLGLGLAIVRRLSDLLGYRVEVRSAPGDGSVFLVEVPLGDASRRREEAPAPRAATPGRLALLIDDDAIVLLGLQAIFQEWGFEVLIAGSGEQALQRLAASGRVPDVVVSDFRLRAGEVGTDAVRRVREQIGHAVPGVILTGETGPECQQEATAAGLGVVHKPVTPRQLAAALQACLGEAA